jgi:hypothetical protein
MEQLCGGPGVPKFDGPFPTYRAFLKTVGIADKGFDKHQSLLFFATVVSDGRNNLMLGLVAAAANRYDLPKIIYSDRLIAS